MYYRRVNQTTGDIKCQQLKFGEENIEEAKRKVIEWNAIKLEDL